MKLDRAKAGSIVYHRDNDDVKMLFMKPSNPKFGGFHYQLAKGTIDDGFTPEQTAVKESLEELGVIPSNIKSIKYLFTDVIKHSSGRSHALYLYAIELDDRNKMIPFHYETDNIKWLDISEIDTQVRRSQLETVHKAYGIIK